MSFLSGIIISLLEWLLGDLISWVKSYIEIKQAASLEKAKQAAALKKQADDIANPKSSDEELSKDAENIYNNNKP